MNELLDINDTQVMTDTSAQADLDADQDASTKAHTASKSEDKANKAPPAVTVPLTGQYLIEASAGTGKTWTLTGIVLRLLIEAKRPPEHIIATTFTRAAAAEMRDRIHKRLIDCHQLLQWLISVQAHESNHAILYPYLTKQNQISAHAADQDEQDKSSLNKRLRDRITIDQRKTRADFIKKNAHSAGLDALIDDPINWHIIEYVLDRALEYPIEQALRRTKLVLTTLDKLFVGTLDSLAQKWLSEYSAETGHQPGMQISMDEDVMVSSIIHDTVRGFYSRIYHDAPLIYALLQSSNRLTEPRDHMGVASKALQFISTPINPVSLPDDIDMSKFRQMLDEFKNSDLDDIKPYFDAEFRVNQGIKEKSKLNTRFDSIYDIQKTIARSGVTFFSELSESALQILEELTAALENGKGFRVKHKDELQVFIQLKSITMLCDIYAYSTRVERYLDALIDTLNYDIAINVRQKLPAMLEAKNETTFTLQMVRLNQALSGRRGAQLARYIRHHYPVALIDESQDINGEQAQMIEHIYLTKRQSEQTGKLPSEQHNNRPSGFLLLVGDPKQAIYGFRGGDVANYNAIKAKFDRQHIMSLDINRRSSKPLITALNHWFGRGQAVDSSNNAAFDAFANLGSQIFYQHITAAKTEPNVSWQMPMDKHMTHTNHPTDELLSSHPVSVLHLLKDGAECNEYQLTARHIQAVLASGQYIDGRPLAPSDIGVLGKNKKGLKQVENELVALGVPTLQTAEVNIFTTKMAEDLAALLEAMLRPNDRGRVNRVLTGSFYQKTLAQVRALIDAMDHDSPDPATSAADDHHTPSYQDFQNHLKHAAMLWQNRGILTALHFLFNQDPMRAGLAGQNNKHNASIWVALTQLKDSTRHLMDLRHLLDILAMFGMHIGEHELLAWFRQQMRATTTPDWARQQPLPTESGVQLMTIHKSKGLEFPLVYVIDIDSASKKVSKSTKNHLFLYGITNEAQITSRRLSVSAGKNSQSAQQSSNHDDYAHMQNMEQYEEYRRLIYVALTRASAQLYMVLKDSSRAAYDNLRPVAHWLESKSSELALPERLQPYIGWLHAEQVLQYRDKMNIDTLSASTISGVADTKTRSKQVRIDYSQAYEVLEQQFFQGWAKTSFTALARSLDHDARAQAVNDDSMEEALDIRGYQAVIEADRTEVLDKEDIRFRFIKGANAGTFLHDVFEKIDFQNDSRWSSVIDHAIRKYQLPSHYASLNHQQRELDAQSLDNAAIEDTQTASTAQALETIDAADHDALLIWIKDVLATPLMASNQPLNAIASHNRVAELSFNMGLSARFSTESINQAFKRHLPDEPDKHVQLDAQSRAYVYRYLRGEIDLVYEHAGKYYVVDYKSNYLGDNLSDYDQASLSAAMSHAGYWLQAAIYQVALHRFLKIRLSDYEGNEDKYLGAVEYVFLRGIAPKALINNINENTNTHESIGEAQGFGRIAWDIPIALIRELDHLFGKPHDGS